MSFFNKLFRRFKKQHLSDDSKLLYLESIRGIAAMIVVFAHILTLYFPYPEVNPGVASAGSSFINNLFYGLPLGFLIAGHFSVIVFFVLSGYVLTYRYYDTKKVKELQKQAAKRYFRLAIPIFATVMLSYFMLASGLMNFREETAAITGSPGALTLFSFDPTFTSALYDATIGVLANGIVQYNPVLWTMPIEFIGSFLIFGLALLVGNLRYRWLFYAGAIVALGQTYYVGFIIGLVLADLYHTTNFFDWVKKVMNKAYVAGALILVLVLASIPMPWTFPGDLLNTLSLSYMDMMTNAKIAHYVGATILLVLAISITGVQKFLSFRPFVWLGSLSFPVYLLHFLVLYSLGTWLFVQLWNSGLGIYGSAGISAVAVIAATLGISVIWKKYIDDMSVRVSRSMARVLLKD